MDKAVFIGLLEKARDRLVTEDFDADLVELISRLHQACKEIISRYGTAETLPADFVMLAKEFANGRASAQRCHTPPEDGFREVWRPTVAGRAVRLSDAPEHGYASRQDALVAGVEFRRQCRSWLLSKGLH